MRSLVLVILAGLGTAAAFSRAASCDEIKAGSASPFWTPSPNMSPNLHDFTNLMTKMENGTYMNNPDKADQLTGKQPLHYFSGTAFIEFSLDDPNTRTSGQIVPGPDVWLGEADVTHMIFIGTNFFNSWKPPANQYWQGADMQINCDTVGGGPQRLVYARVSHV